MSRTTRALVSAREVFGRRVGFSAFRYPLANSLDAELRRVFVGGSPMTLLIDVGGHAGGFGRRARQCGFTGRIVSFEPGPVFVDLEAAAASDPLWSATNCAISDHEGQLDLMLAEKSDFNSVHRLREHALELFPDIRPIGHVSVDVHRLDGLLDGIIESGDRAFLKSDTQGHDLAVLRGCGGRLREFEALLIETSVVALYEDAPMIDEVIAFLRSEGFVFQGAFSVSRSGLIAEFDCLFVRQQ